MIIDDESLSSYDEAMLQRICQTYPDCYRWGWPSWSFPIKSPIDLQYPVDSIGSEILGTTICSSPSTFFEYSNHGNYATRSSQLVYHSVCQAMPPVEEWRYFNFGYSAAGEMARVVHPVD